MNVIVIFNKAAADGFFERITECDRSEELGQRFCAFLVILTYRCGRKTEAMLEKYWRVVDEGRSPEIMHFIRNEQVRAVECFNGGPEF